MKNNRKAEIKVGITVIVAILILLWLFGWAKNYNISGSQKELLIRFDNIAGLEIGDRVTINGIRRGSVESFLNDGNTVIVKTLMDGDAELKEDAQFTILMLDLMGGKKIEIIPGTSANPIDYSQIQNGYFSGDISTAMAMLSSVQGDLVDVIKEVKVSLNNMNEIIADEEFSGNVKTSVENINKLSIQLSALIESNKKDISGLISSSKNLTESANDLITENKEQIGETIKRLNEFINNSNTLVNKIDESISEIKNKENNLGKILYDENFLKGLTETLDQVKELTKLLKTQMEGDGINVDANIF
ncbi:MAG: ABC transporter substrate-binding protein [Ignavibacteria bacterium GWB2_35_6b]|nr:MAG: ABC transporter substrate-binding protein [Ignavibacteria bacterium GWB2_35_6b]